MRTRALGLGLVNNGVLSVAAFPRCVPRPAPSLQRGVRGCESHYDSYAKRPPIAQCPGMPLGAAVRPSELGLRRSRRNCARRHQPCDLRHDRVAIQRHPFPSQSRHDAAAAAPAEAAARQGTRSVPFRCSLSRASRTTPVELSNDSGGSNLDQ